MSGEAALRQQEWADAAQQMKKSLELNPDFDQAMTGLAHALFGLGNKTEAQRRLEKALQYTR
jgi:uncharacterized protein HemY